MLIRLINQDQTHPEFAQAYALHQRAHVQPWSLSTFVDSTHKTYQCFVAKHHEAISGYAIVQIIADEATLIDITVSENCRNQGIGKQLVLEIINASCAANAACLWLEVRASNTPAIALYKQCGFETVTVRKQYYMAESGREDGIVMRLDLVKN